MDEEDLKLPMKLNHLFTDLDLQIEKKDYNFNDIIYNLNALIENCPSKFLYYIKNRLIEIDKSGTYLHKFIVDEVMKTYTKRVTMSERKDNDRQMKPIAHWVKKDGKIAGVESQYWYDTGIDFRKLPLSRFQHHFGMEEAKGTYKNEEEFRQIFSGYIDVVLSECKDEEDIRTFRELLTEMRKLGIVGEMVYDGFYDKISLENVPLAQKRNQERKLAQKKNNEEESDKKEFDRKVSIILDDYASILSYEGGIDLNELREIYERGQTLLAQAKLRGDSIIAELRDITNGARDIIQTLEEI